MARQALASSLGDVSRSIVQIPLQDFSGSDDVQRLKSRMGELDDAVKSLETTMTDNLGLELPDIANKNTQTEGLTLRECGELTNSQTH